MILANVGLDHASTADVLLHHRIHLIQSLLDLRVHGDGTGKHQDQRNEENGQRAQQDNTKAHLQKQ